MFTLAAAKLKNSPLAKLDRFASDNVPVVPSTVTLPMALVNVSSSVVAPAGVF